MTAAVALAARSALAAVFAAAASAKLRDRGGTREGVTAFGLPRAVATPLAAVLPAVELVVAAALVPDVSARWGALGAAALLLAFAVAMAANLARGRAPACHCFGEVSSRPISGRTLTRNCVLAAIALAVFWTAPADAASTAMRWAAGLTTAQLAGFLAAGGVLALGAWLQFNLLRQHGRMLLRLEALEAAAASRDGSGALDSGAPAAPFVLPDLDGRYVALDGLREHGFDVILVFVDAECGPCRSLLPELAHWQRQLADRLTLAVVARGDREALRALLAARDPALRVLLQEDGEVAAAYRVLGTPSAVLVAADGRLASPVAAGASAIRALVGRTTAAALLDAPLDGGPTSTGSPAAAVGEPAPDFILPDLDGKAVQLADFAGRESIVIFWNPDCDFCRAMLDRLRAWDETTPTRERRLVLISSGSPEVNRALGLTAPILLDETFTTGRAFGARGTPSAVLLDAHGHVASPVSVGEAAVFGLAGSEAEPVELEEAI